MLGVVMLCLTVVMLSVPSSARAATVQTTFGALTGRTLANGIEEYVGIPFATAMRWADPVDWSQNWATPRPALTAMPGCGKDSSKENGGPGWSEDCLYLNIWTPRNTAQTPLPVLFFIYGGAFVSGEASGYNCSLLAQKHNAVYVTANYRLDALGWLAITPTSANFGLKDQQSALRWTNREIASFGGDTSRLMIFGESAGAISTVTHLLSPQSKGLFKRALSESGNCGGASSVVAANQTLFFNKKLGCAVGDLACMRKKSLDEITAASAVIVPPGCPIGVCQGYGPVVDGVSLPMDSTIMLQQGLFNKDVDVVLGTNTNEGSAFAYDAIHFPYTSRNFRDYVIAVLGHGAPVADKIVDKVVGRYPPSVKNQRVLAGDFFGDLAFTCPSRHVLRLLSTHSDRPVYKFRFNYVAESDPSPKAMGVSHGDEVPFVFDAGDWIGYNGKSKFTGTEEQFASDIGASWARFADTAVPGNGWKPYSNASEAEAILQPGSWPMEKGWRADYCQFWDTFCDNHFCDPNTTAAIQRFR